MKQIMKNRLLMVGLLVVLATALYSCGGSGSSYGGGGSGGGTAAPGAFSLGSPAAGATGVGTTPTFVWSPSTDAADYRVQVDTSGTFTGALVINTTVNSTTYSYTVLPSANLASGTPYYWHVIAENTYGQATAGPRTFTP